MREREGERDREREKARERHIMRGKAEKELKKQEIDRKRGYVRKKDERESLIY